MVSNKEDIIFGINEEFIDCSQKEIVEILAKHFSINPNSIDFGYSSDNDACAIVEFELSEKDIKRILAARFLVDTEDINFYKAEEEEIKSNVFETYKEIGIFDSVSQEEGNFTTESADELTHLGYDECVDVVDNINAKITISSNV